MIKPGIEKKGNVNVNLSSDANELMCNVCGWYEKATENGLNEFIIHHDRAKKIRKNEANNNTPKFFCGKIYGALEQCVCVCVCVCGFWGLTVLVSRRETSCVYILI